METPGWIVNENGPKADSVEICGFFAFVDYEPTKEKLDVLHLIPISKEGSECMPCRTFQLELTPGFLTKAITQKIQPDGSKMTTWKYLEPMLNLLLYICTAVDDLGDHGKKPQFPVPVKTKKGLKYFQPDKPAVWDCGVRIGAALRAGREAQGETIQPQESSSPHRRSPRPHMRRAYWKAVWRGPIKSPGLREKYARWFPPTPVNMKDAGDMPAVIHPVPRE